MISPRIFKPFTPLLLLIFVACSPFSVIDAIVPEEGYERETAIPYGAEERQKLDLYRPTRPNSDHSIIVFLYGGSWRMGDRRQYRFAAQPLAAAGYTTVVPDYRLYPEVRFPDFVSDAAKAVAWVQRELVGEGEPPRIVLVGHSAGAHTAALLALDRRFLVAEGLSSSILKGWVGLAGPYAFNPLKTRSVRPVFELIAGDIDQGRPIAFARPGAPPALLLHGTSDTTVYPLNSERLEAALRLAGSSVIYKPLENVGHIAIVVSIAQPGLGGAKIVSEIAQFIRGL